MKKTFFTLAILFLAMVSKGQNYMNYSVNIAVDTLSADKKEVFGLWFDYLKSKPDSIYNNPYWNSAEKTQYKSYDLLKSEGFISPSLYYFVEQHHSVDKSVGQ